MAQEFFLILTLQAIIQRSNPSDNLQRHFQVINVHLLPTELTVQGELSLATPTAAPEVSGESLHPVYLAANPDFEAALRASQLLAGGGQTERTLDE
ncbi:MAG: hypothetical protein IPO91_28780 [Chloroflexi bacterium]|nr:hypothetical protein [Chloroflexota bacterium]